jgi:hypothetical protein
LESIKMTKKKPAEPPIMFPVFGRHRATGSLVIYASGQDFSRCGITRFGNSECSMLWESQEPKAVWENAVYQLFHSAWAKQQRAKAIPKPIPKVQPKPVPEVSSGIAEAGNFLQAGLF